MMAALVTALGCYLPWLVLRQGRTVWMLLPSAVSLVPLV
jgi:small multidrug resistance family-3 protein